MSESKWVEFSNKVEHLIDEYNKIKKESRELKDEIEELKKQNIKLSRESKNDMPLKERIRFLEQERGIIREKTKKLLKILREH